MQVVVLRHRRMAMIADDPDMQWSIPLITCGDGVRGRDGAIDIANDLADRIGIMTERMGELVGTRDGQHGKAWTHRGEAPEEVCGGRLFDPSPP